MSAAIEIKKISKKYELSHQRKAPYRSMRDDIIQLLRKPFGLLGSSRDTKEEFWALKDVSFDVNPGDVIGIIGRNGSGKSTLLKILSRIVEPTSGEAILRGNVASLLEVGTGFHPELTGRENIYFNGSILGMPKKEIDQKFEEIVAFAGVEKFLDTPVKFYSSGMYVRLAFAVAAHLDPEILIIDEVLAVGDAEFQKKCLGKMSDVAQAGRTVLFVSHNMLAVEQLCNTIVHMDGGKVVNSGTDVKGIIQQYLFSGQEATGQAEWHGKPLTNEYLTINKLALVDAKGTVIHGPITGSDEVWAEISGTIHNLNPLLSIGYALFSEDAIPLHWSFHTDLTEDKWPKLKKGPFKLRSRLSNLPLNEGQYRLELAASLFAKGWFFEPGNSPAAVYFNVPAEPTGSPYWVSKRPTALAVAQPWELASPKS